MGDGQAAMNLRLLSTPTSEVGLPLSRIFRLRADGPKDRKVFLVPVLVFGSKRQKKDLTRTSA